MPFIWYSIVFIITHLAKFLPTPTLSPQKGIWTTQGAAIQSKIVLTIYMIQLQRSVLAGLVHFVQGICIFLWDENAIN